MNTLFLAYAGASLTLLLLFQEAGESFASIATREIVAVGIVRALVGSIELVALVPISTALAATILGLTAPTAASGNVDVTASDRAAFAAGTDGSVPQA